MGVVFDYFAAPDESAAAAVADTGPRPAGLPSVPGGLVDPTTHLAPALALLLGRAKVDIGPTFGDPVALVNDGQQIVLPLTAVVSDTLRNADPDRFGAVATAWAADGGFWRPPDPSTLAAFLADAAELAAGGTRLWCWLSV